MKIKLLVDIDFEFSGMKKTRFKAGQIFNDATPAFTFKKGILGWEQTDIIDGYWIGSERTPQNPKLEAPGFLIRTKCLLRECEVL